MCDNKRNDKERIEVVLRVAIRKALGMKKAQARHMKWGPGIGLCVSAAPADTVMSK